MKNYKIIQTQNYLLVVDETDGITIPSGEYFLLGSEKKGFRINKYLDTSKTGKERYTTELSRKIICHLPLNNSPVLEGVDLLPENVQFPAIDMPFKYTKQKEVEDYIDGFKDGYKAATKTYSEGNLQGLIQVLLEAHTIGTTVFMKRKADEYIQSLNKAKLPVGFEAEIEPCCQVNCTGRCEQWESTTKIRTITNEQGIPVWQGTYLY